MGSIGLAYFVTLCLYPGIMSEIISCKLESWMPVILMTAFNASDVLGKVQRICTSRIYSLKIELSRTCVCIHFYHLMFQILALIPYDWKRTQLLLFASVRVILIPLFLLCALPRSTPILSGEGYPLLLSCLLGVTNGIVGSVPMTQAPSKVSEGHRELAGSTCYTYYFKFR